MWLNRVHTGHVEPTGHQGCSLGQSGHFGWSHACHDKQGFENSQKSVFGRTLEPHMGMKEWLARVGPARDSLSDLRALQNRRHFWPTMLGDKRKKTPFYAN